MRTKKATKNADGLDDEDVPTHLLIPDWLGSLEQRDFRVRVTRIHVCVGHVDVDPVYTFGWVT